MAVREIFIKMFPVSALNAYAATAAEHEAWCQSSQVSNTPSAGSTFPVAAQHP